MEGKKFFNREHEIESLSARVREGNHTLLVGQRRMGKTSVVRELLRRIEETGEFATVFVDFEDAQSPAETVETWWRMRHGRRFTPIRDRTGDP